MFYGLAENESWFKERINLFVALAPAVKITNTKSKAIRLLSKWEEGFPRTYLQLPPSSHAGNQRALRQRLGDLAEKV